MRGFNFGRIILVCVLLIGILCLFGCDAHAAGFLLAAAPVMPWFRPPGAFVQPQVDRGEVRAFVVKSEDGKSGTPYLKVPGLRKVLSVRVGQTVIPMTLRQGFPGEGFLQGKGNTVWTEWEMFALVPDTDGSPVLLRHAQSNDGIWQEGATVYVGGEWAPDEAEEDGGSGEDAPLGGADTPKGKPGK